MNYIELNDGKHLYLSDFNMIINREIKEQFEKSSHRKTLEIRDEKITADELKLKVKDINQIIFQTTKDCNLSCKYCAYSGAYTYQRTTSKKNLDFEIAKQSLDLMYDTLKDRMKKEVILSFYGGEPLLNFDVLKKTVKYAEDLFEGWVLKHIMTTNLTLLTDKILDFLVDKDFSLSISLDGPLENHDAKRVYNNGTGTFQNVYDNIKKIKEKSEKYYSEKVGFEAVYSDDLSLEKMYDFFVDDDLVNKKRVQFSPVDKYDTDYYKKYPNDEKRVKKETEKIIDKIEKKMENNEKLHPFERNMYSGARKTKIYLNRRDITTFANTCLFDSRIFIDVDGNFHVCEKINEQFSFGNVKDGFDFERMEKILEEFSNLIKAECMDCEVRSLCYRCFIPFAKDGKFKLNKDYCQDIKEFAIRNMERVIRLEREGWKYQ